MAACACSAPGRRAASALAVTPEAGGEDVRMCTHRGAGECHRIAGLQLTQLRIQLGCGKGASLEVRCKSSRANSVDVDPPASGPMSTACLPDSCHRAAHAPAFDFEAFWTPSSRKQRW